MCWHHHQTLTQLPQPIGKAQPVNQDWFDICDLQSSNFLALVKEARRTPRDQLMHPMHAALQRVASSSRANKVSLITILPTTPVDTQPLLRGWQLNPDGVPPAVRQEDDGTMHLLDVDIWMLGASNCTQNSYTCLSADDLEAVPATRAMGSPGWNQLYPPTHWDTLQSSIQRLYEWGVHTACTVPIGELALWLAESAGITTECAQWIEHFAARVASGEAHNGPAWASKPKKDTGEQHRIKKFLKQLQTSRLDYELKEFVHCPCSGRSCSSCKCC